MALRDRLRRGLTKRLIVDGIWEPLAVVLAYASYPDPARQPMRSVVRPKAAGQIIDRTIVPEQNDVRSLLHRMEDPEEAARARAERLSRTLFGIPAADVLARAYGTAMAQLWDPDWEPPRSSNVGSRPRVITRTVPFGGAEIIFERPAGGGAIVVKARGFGGAPARSVVQSAKARLRRYQLTHGEAPWY